MLHRTAILLGGRRGGAQSTGHAVVSVGRQGLERYPPAQAVMHLAITSTVEGKNILWLKKDTGEQ